MMAEHTASRRPPLVIMVCKKMHRYCLLLLLIWSPSLFAQNCTDICERNAVCEGDECVCDDSSFSPTGSNTDCRSRSAPFLPCRNRDPNCIFCGAANDQPCMWCVGFVYQDSCLRNCTGTIAIRPIPSLGIPVSYCDAAGGNSSSFPQWAIIVIIVVVVLIVITAAVIVIVLVVRALQRTSRGMFEVVDSGKSGDSAPGTMRTKRSNSFSFSFNKINKNRPDDRENDYVPGLSSHDASTAEEEDEMDEIDGDEETVFRHKVEMLKPQSTVFLQMLNDMRRRSKELPEGSPAEEQYRKVMRDVTRLLYILNKKPSRLQMPPDGLELMRWSQKILKKYQSSVTRENTLERSSEPRYVPTEPTNTSDDNVFLGKLAFLQDHSDVFLRMLNELRRKLKELRPEIPITRKYKEMVKVLSRLLELINKDPDEVKMPSDGLQLVNKAERLLEGYLAGQGFNPDYENDDETSYSEDTTHF